MFKVDDNIAVKRWAASLSCVSDEALDGKILAMWRQVMRPKPTTSSAVTALERDIEKIVKSMAIKGTRPEIFDYNFFAAQIVCKALAHFFRSTCFHISYKGLDCLS